MSKLTMAGALVLGVAVGLSACDDEGETTPGPTVTGSGGGSSTGGSSAGTTTGVAGSGGTTPTGAAGGAPPGGQIIADHTVVDRYDDIPPAILDQVKTMWFNIIGESHSTGYLRGLEFLTAEDATYAVVITEGGAPAPAQSGALRASRALRDNQYNGWDWGGGEAIWYTNDAGKTRITEHLSYCAANDLVIGAIGFGWCWDMTWHNSPAGGVDPVHQVRWAGSSEGGPDGDQRWGLDAADTALTGNQISMDTYLTATDEYAAYCASNSIATQVVFTTGPVDGYAGESGYQRHLKHEHLRAHVLADPNRILFDYADILAWNEAGEQHLQTWTDGTGTDHDYQMIHPDNMLELDGSPHSEDGDHIGGRGALRLGKAIWWMMARIAGWNGS